MARTRATAICSARLDLIFFIRSSSSFLNFSVIVLAEHKIILLYVPMIVNAFHKIIVRFREQTPLRTSKAPPGSWPPEWDTHFESLRVAFSTMASLSPERSGRVHQEEVLKIEQFLPWRVFSQYRIPKGEGRYPLGRIDFSGRVW